MGRIKSLWSVLQWVVIPVLVFGVAEAAYRMKLGASNNWYRDNVPSDGSRQILFLGTSRTRSAVDEKVFSECLSSDLGAARVVNLGMGNSTQAIHLHALRDRVWANPRALQETTLFVETVLGMPSFYFPQEFVWEDVRHETMPWRWYLYLDAGTVLDPRFFVRADLDFEGRLKLGVRTTTRDLLLFGKREIVGLRWRGMATTAVKKLIGYGTPQEVESGSIDLRSGGGVRTDAEGVEAMGAFERQMADSLVAFDAELPSPEDTPAGALIDFALEHGAKIVCFDIPTHSSKRQGFDKPNLQRFADAFSVFLEERRVPLVTADVAYADTEFPDGSHLAGSQAADFTRKLCEAWMKPRASVHVDRLD